MSVMKAFAANAERLGFSTLWAPEHVVLVDQYKSRYPYRDEGTFPAPTDAPIADPFLTLCTLASVTEKIRLGTAICLVPEHNPLVLGKVIATLDCLSNGRAVLGVGVAGRRIPCARHPMAATCAAHPRVHRSDAPPMERPA
jgi:alkanesulfonate monooxygenase SsuD/methylene tetrahydromethanopterin reductase-like flavin-dependent oxidoreductase (luciferase family)